MFRFLLILFLAVSGVVRAQTGAESGAIRDAYVLQVGDSFEVTYTYTPEYNQTVLVSPDGVVGLTRVGPVNVGGLTVSAARVRITEAASRSGLNEPEVFLTLRDYLRPQFTVLGEVFKPGKYDLRGPLRVADGLAVAGGLNLNGRHKNIILIHPIDETTGVASLVNYKRLEKGKGEINFDELRAGDIIVVPTSNLSKIERLVKLINVGIFYNPIP